MSKFHAIFDRFRESFISHVFELIAAAIVGAVLMTGWFFISSASPQDQAVLAEVHELARERLRKLGVIEAGTQSTVSYTDSLKISFSSEAILVWGKYRPSKKIDGVPIQQRDTSLFVAVIENGQKTLIGTLIGNPYPKVISSFLTFDGYSSEIEIKNQRSEDIIKSGEKQILFDIVQYYGDGRGISPVILQKAGSNWRPILINGFADEVNSLIVETNKKKHIRYSNTNIEYLFENQKLGKLSEQTTFSESWTINLDNKIYEFKSLRNSSGYMFLDHPATGKKDLVIALSLLDDCVLCSHHVFIKAFSLQILDKEFEWNGDKSWNQGRGFISTEPMHYKDINYEEIFHIGFSSNKDGAYFLGPYFTKEIQ